MYRRRFALLTLLCQLSLAAVAPVQDARLEARASAAGAELHVETTGTPLCVPTHDHGACPICRAVETFDASPECGVRVQAARPREFVEVQSFDVAYRATAPDRSQGPRAPPAV